ncbi:hypothetical protein [Hymenobacter elongatus]|uniref:DUF4168 domain-containing protein n=1 Tax=Hymenobacter elongatus TaxID=877208 RepID=A0A4Z0PGG3_9BACT|nr:hypothetical protein [Hymenobacter elongatus]TGE13892.1 hypothetical protein E5J99_18410 [Hymenobacter elongatus]
MKYLFTLALFLSVHFAQAQLYLLNGGIAAARLAAQAASHKKKSPAGKKKTATTPEPAVVVTPVVTPERYVTPFTYHGQAVSRQRTAADKLKGKGATEILALEASLEQSHAALLADSVSSFLPTAHYDAIVAAARKAAATRPGWDYSPYQQELAFYQQEEARRQKAAQPSPAK